MAGSACPLCEGPGGVLLARGSQLRVIRAAEEGFPAFYRVVWQAHVAELSQLSPAERQACMDAVVCVEQALLDHLPAALRPAKINLAALGNMVPHLHWHVIARHEWDSRFPATLWAPAVRTAPAERLAALQSALPAVEAAMVRALAAAGLAQPVEAH
ncbi:MAG: HIT family protein [Burkholderiaceae bacterium]|nr:HIT family protein [Burkholderiaceae bacterium]